MGWVSAQQLYSQNSIGRIDPKGLVYNDRNTVLKMFYMLPIGQAENNIYDTHKSIRKRALFDIEPALETRNRFINVINPQSLEQVEQEIAEAEQRIRAGIPEPLKKLYLCIPRKYLNVPNCFALPECLKNEGGRIRFLSSSQGVFDYAFEHLSSMVYRLEMDGSWSEYGIIDGFVVTQLFWNIMNREDLAIVLAEMETDNDI